MSNFFLNEGTYKSTMNYYYFFNFTKITCYLIYIRDNINYTSFENLQRSKDILGDFQGYLLSFVIMWKFGVRNAPEVHHQMEEHFKNPARSVLALVHIFQSYFWHHHRLQDKALAGNMKCSKATIKYQSFKYGFSKWKKL